VEDDDCEAEVDRLEEEPLPPEVGGVVVVPGAGVVAGGAEVSGVVAPVVGATEVEPVWVAAEQEAGPPGWMVKTPIGKRGRSSESRSSCDYTK
jgi:hypothetical protein